MTAIRREKRSPDECRTTASLFACAFPQPVGQVVSVPSGSLQTAW